MFPQAKREGDVTVAAATSAIARRCRPPHAIALRYGLALLPRSGARALAQAKATEALGLARAKGYEEQRKALGEAAIALVNAISEVGDGNVKIVPDVLVTGGNGSLDALADRW